MKYLFFCFICNVLLADEPYILMQLGGRLGNQMFQIAAALSLAEDVGAIAIFPDMIKKHGNNISLNHQIFFPTLSTYEPSVSPTYKYQEHDHFHFAPIPYRPNMEISGYFQSEKHFKHHKDKICALFEPSQEIKGYLTDKYRALLEHSNTVAIHLRAYKLESIKLEKDYPFLNGEYYMSAADIFPEDAIFVIFSDRIEWAKEEMKGFERPHIFIENEPYYHDFYLMSFCKHQIISPSSFSWWAAYLNKNPNKVVVAPDPWFNPVSHHDSSNVIPDEWHKMHWAKECHYRGRRGRIRNSE